MCSVQGVPVKGDYIMFSESEKEEVQEMLKGQMEVLKILVDAALETNAPNSIARLYRAMFGALRNEGFSPAEAIELMKYRDLININKGD